MSREHPCPHPGCTQSYARIEHMERHAKSHAPGHGYQCDVCGKEFARSDVLRRHMKIHARQESPSIEPSESGDRRPFRACRLCAAAKTKCTGHQPCERCTGLEKECVYDPTPQRAPPLKRARFENAKSPSETVTSTSATISMSPSGSLPSGSIDLTVGSLVSPGDYVQRSPSNSTPASSYALDTMFDPDMNIFNLPTNSSQSVAGPGPRSMQNHSLNGMASASPSTGDPLAHFANFALQQTTAVPGQDLLMATDLSAAFFLPTNDNLFWSSFLNSPPPLGLTAGVPRPGRPHRPRIMITASGLPSRHGSPGLLEDEPSPALGTIEGTKNGWPTWDPTGEEIEVQLDEGVPTEGVLSAMLPPNLHVPARFNHQVHKSLLENLRFAPMGDDEYHALYRTLSGVPLGTFDLLLALYFHWFHPIYPIIHVPTFNPNNTLGQLLLTILGIGAIHAPWPAALQLGKVLIEVARRGIEHLLNRDNRLARSIPVAQSMMLWSTTRYLGSARTLEVAEVFRNAHTTMFRHMSIFDESMNRPIPPHLPAETQWSLFIKQEERRRTAMVCFLIESEVTTLLHHPSNLPWAELKTLLPCSDEMWSATSAEEWLNLKSSSPEPMEHASVQKLLVSESTFPLPSTIRLTPFASRIFVQGLHLMVAQARQLTLTGMSNVADLVKANARRSLGRFARGSDEFSPKLDPGGKDDDLTDRNYVPVQVCYHLAHIATHVAFDELDLVARKGSTENALSKRNEIVQWMSHHQDRARVVALHAGQIMRLIRDRPGYGTYESSSLFYAGLCLYLFARSSASSVEGSSAATSVTEYRLDARPSSNSIESDPSMYIALGGQATLFELTCGPLKGREAGIEILRLTAQSLMRVGAVWRIGHVFSKILSNLASFDVDSSSPNDI